MPIQVVVFLMPLMSHNRSECRDFPGIIVEYPLPFGSHAGLDKPTFETVTVQDEYFGKALRESLPSLTGLHQVVETATVHGEEADRGAVLGAHVGDGGAVGDRQLGHARAEKLDKLARHAHLSQVLAAAETAG